MAREGHVCSPRRRPLPASTVHDPGWHPGRFTCYSLSDHDAALAARNLGHLSSCLQRLWMNCDARFEVWLESCNHDRPAISLRGGALSSHPTPCTRYDKCAQELEQLVLSISAPEDAKGRRMDMRRQSPPRPVMTFHRNKARCLPPSRAKERRAVKEPRIGSFEVVFAIFPDVTPDRKQRKEFVLWSKLDSQAFPRIDQLEDKLKTALQTSRQIQASLQIQGILRRRWKKRNDDLLEIRISHQIHACAQIQAMLRRILRKRKRMRIDSFWAVLMGRILPICMRRGLARRRYINQLSECILLQALLRSAHATCRFQILHSAATRLQGRIRLALWHLHARKHAATVVLQALVRCQVTMGHQKRRCAIRRFMRRSKHRNELLLLRHKTVLLQNAFRRDLAMRYVVTYVERMRSATAVSQLQSCFRRIIVHPEFRRRQKAALLIQCALIGLCARWKCQRLRNDAICFNAARLIQCAIRGSQSNRQFQGMKNEAAALRIQRVSRVLLGKKLLTMFRARARLQGFLKTMLVRRGRERETIQAAKLQCALRSMIARRQLAVQRDISKKATVLRINCTIQIQRWWRTLLNKTAAAALQRIVRATLERQTHVQRLKNMWMSQAILALQSRVRRAKVQRRHFFNKLRAASTRIQRWLRGIPKNMKKPIVLEDDAQEIETDQIYVMYHGTKSLEVAALIEQQGFKPSTGGLLGPGLYVSRNMKKAEQYTGSDGVIFEVLVKVGRVCHIKDHEVSVPAQGLPLAPGASRTMVAAKDLVPGEWSREAPWHDAGYDTAWVPEDCPSHVFRGGAGWSQGHVEETCVFDPSRITVQRRSVWDTGRDEVKRVQWMFEEDTNRIAGHRGADIADIQGLFVPFSRRLSILIESHHLIYKDGRGKAQAIVTIEADRKIFHSHTGLQYEVDFDRYIQRNVMTGYERRLRRRDPMQEVAIIVLQSRVRRAKVQRRHFFNKLRAASTRIQRWLRGIPKNMKKPIVLEDDAQEIETDQIYVMYHGTKSLEVAALIEQQGFKPSTGGLLGPGLYVSRNMKKAEQYTGSDGVIFEVLVKVGRVCHIKDHEVSVPAQGLPLAPGASRTMVAAKDLVPGEWSREAPWHDAGYDTAWVPEDCPSHVFRGGAGWSQGHVEETCVFDPSRITVQRRSVWDTGRDEVKRVQWMFEEDTNRIAGHRGADIADIQGLFVPFSRRLSILIESHHLIYKDGRGKAQAIVTIEADRKIFHSHTGLQYEVDFDRYIQRNVMTGYERRLRRRDPMQEVAIIVLQSRVRRAKVQRRHFFNKLRAASTRIQRWLRGIPKNMKKPIVLEDDAQEIETDQIYVMYHGTKSLEVAALIEQQGFKPSTGGLLGPGLYVSRNMKKAEQYTGSDGVIFEVLVKVGRVCHIKDHEVSVPAQGLPLAPGASRTMVAAKDLVPGEWSREAPWHDAGYDTAWVPEDCPSHVFRGGAGWSQGHVEETCVFDPSRITVQRRSVWDTGRDEVKRVQWMFEEDTNRIAGHRGADIADIQGLFVPFSRRLSILIESHHLIYKDGRGKAQAIVTIEADRKIFHSHTGLQYEVDFDRYIQRNVMTGYERRLRRRDPMQEVAIIVLQSRVRRAKVQRRHFFNKLRAASTRIQRWLRKMSQNSVQPIVLEDDAQEIETDQIYVMYHGTKSLEVAALIEQQGFKPSTGGLLGPGLYVSRNMKKAEQYTGSDGVIFEVLVKVGRVCHIKDHEVSVPAQGLPLAPGASRTMVAAKDLVPGEWSREAPWHDAGYDTAWVPEDCPSHVFRGGAGWSQGHVEETCVFDPSRITVQRRSVWDTGRDEVKRVQWMFEEDTNRIAGHRGADIADVDGQFVPFSRRLSILIESHHLIYKDGRGKAQAIVTIEADRKIFHSHTGLQYEVDFDRYIQRNVMTGYERRLRRKDPVERLRREDPVELNRTPQDQQPVFCSCCAPH